MKFLQNCIIFVDFSFFLLDSLILMQLCRNPCNGVHVIKENCIFTVFSAN